MSFPDNLRTIRRIRQLKQSELGDLLTPRRGQRAISHWETGIRAPGLRMIQQLSEALGVPVGALMGEEPLELEEEAVPA